MTEKKEDEINLIGMNEHNVRGLLQMVLAIMTNEQLEILKKELTELEKENKENKKETNYTA